MSFFSDEPIIGRDFKRSSLAKILRNSEDEDTEEEEEGERYYLKKSELSLIAEKDEIKPGDSVHLEDDLGNKLIITIISEEE